MTIPPGYLAWLSLGLIPGLGAAHFVKLLQAFGGPEQVLGASHQQLSQWVKSAVAAAILKGPDPDALSQSLAWLEGDRNQLITLADDYYPQLLLQLTDPPPILYSSGCLELLTQPAIAVVGSRNATPQGLKNAEQFSQTLSQAGLCIVSGLASGVDAAAHRGGLQGSSSSIAVIGTGLDIVYPASNRGLAHELAEKGLLISEFPLGTPPIAKNFPRRNRIISGMSLGCLVVEATIRSGSLITAKQAAEQGREVFAIPGSIHSPLAKGCHALIKQGAKLVESAQDILEELHWTNSRRAIVAEGAATESKDPLLSHLGYDPCDIDTLCARSNLAVDVVSAALLSLELAGQVNRLPGGLYQRLV